MAKADDNLPEGFSSPSVDQDDQEQDATIEPGDVYEGIYLGVAKSGEGEYSPWYIAKIKTDDGVEHVFAKDTFKGMITREELEPGTPIYYEALEYVDDPEYGEQLEIAFGTGD